MMLKEMIDVGGWFGFVVWVMCLVEIVVLLVMSLVDGLH